MDRNDKELTEAAKIKKRLQKYTEELYRKGLNDPDNHDGVVTHLEPDILEYKVKWALGSITSSKASGGDAVATELLKILRGCCESAALGMPANMSENSQWPQDWKRSVFIPIPKRAMSRNIQTTNHLNLFHMLTR